MVQLSSRFFQAVLIVMANVERRWWSVSGQGTNVKGSWYNGTIGEEGGRYYACQINDLAPYFQKNYVALNVHQYNNDSCQRCVKVTCASPPLNSEGKPDTNAWAPCDNKREPVYLMIVDKCPGTCEYGQLDMSKGGFEEVFGVVVGQGRINWSYAPCCEAYQVSGNVKFAWNVKAQQYWLAFNLANLNDHIKGVKCNGEAADSTDWGHWTCKGEINGKWSLTIETDSGQERTVTMDAVGSHPSTQSIDLGFQFNPPPGCQGSGGGN